MSRVSSGYSLVAEDRHRQFGRRRQHLDLAGEDLDLPGRQVGVLRSGGPRPDLPVDPDHPLRAHFLGRLEGRRIRVGDHLGQAVVVAKVDEQQPAMVAHAVHPARQADGLRRCQSARSAPQVWVR